MSVQTRRFLILLSVVAVVGVAAGGLWLFREGQIARRVAESRERGMAAHAEGRFDEAMLRDLSYVAARDKEDGEAMYALADARRHLPVENGRHIVSAIAFAQAAVELLPGDDRPLELLVELYSYAGFVGEVIETSDKLLAKTPNHKDALQAKIRALRTKGSLDDALTVARRLAAAYPSDVTSHLFVLDLLRLKGGPIDDRIVYVDALAGRMPNEPDILLLQARIAGSAGDFEKASKIVRQVADMPFTSASTLTEAVRLMDLLRLSDEAVAMLNRQSADPAMADAAALLAAERGWKAGLLTDCLSALSILLKDPTTAADGALGLAALLRQMGVTEGLPDNVETVLRSRTTLSAQAWASLLDARALLQQGDLDEASRAVNRALDAQVATDVALYTRAQLELARAEPTSAAKTLEELVRIEPRWLDPRMLLIATLADLGQLDDAVDEAQKCAAVFPRRLEPYNALAQVTTMLVENGQATSQQVTTMLELLDKLAEENVDQQAVLSMRARVLAASGRKKEAGDAIARALNEGMSLSPETLQNLLRVARQLDRPEVLSELEAMLAEAPSNPSLILDRALAAAREGRIKEGQAMLRDAVAQAQEQERIAYQRALASYLEQVGDSEGLATREKLAEEYPSNLALQIDVLRSERAWTSQATIQVALDRIKSLAGPGSTVWKLGEARRLLTFDRTQANAASAASILNDVVRTEPDNLQAILLLGDANIVLGDQPSALVLFNKAIDVAPKESGLYPRVIRMLQESGASAQAERRLRDFVKLGDLPIEMRRQRAQLLVYQAMWPEAEADLRVIAQSDNDRDRLALAEFLAARGRPAEAAPLYNAIVARDDADSAALQAAAEFFVEQGDEARSVQIIERVRASLPGIMGDLVYAGYLERRARLEEAEAIYTQVASTANDPNVWAELSAFYIRRNDIAKAQQAVTDGLALDATNETLTTLNRLLAEASGQPAGAGSVLDPAVAELRQIQNSRPQKREEAPAYLERLRGLTLKYPTFLSVWAALVRESIAFGKPEMAAAAAQGAAQALPSDPRAARLAAETLAQVGQLTEAIAMAKNWRDRSLRDPFEADLMLAGLEAKAGRGADALALLTVHRDRLLKQPGESIDAVALYGSLLASAGRIDEARALLASQGLSGDGKAQIFLAVARGLFPRPGDARAWLSEASGSMNMDDPSHVLALGQVWFDLAGARGGTVDDFQKVIEIAARLQSDPDRRIAAAGLLASAYDQTGRFNEAEVAYRAVLEANPDQPVILNNLAYLILKRDKTAVSEEPVRLAESAIALARSQGLAPAIQASMMDTLGAAQIRAGHPVDAARTFRTALDMLPDDPELVAGLAQSLVLQADPSKMEEVKVLISRFDRLARTRNVTPTATERITPVRAAASAR